MSITICPTVTAYDNHSYREQIERVVPFAERLHIDLMDGEFTQTRSPGPDEIWLPEGLVTDIHVMFQRPMEQLDKLIGLSPSMILLQAEADVNYREFLDKLRNAGIKAGIVVLQDTPVDHVGDYLHELDHLLIFSGTLGYHGGTANLELLNKVLAAKNINPEIEVGWDGGINDQNAPAMADKGVTVLNVGSYIQAANDPLQAYRNLKHLFE